MTILKCKMCGGNIEAAPDKTYGTCDSCGNTMTLPKVSDEQRANLFNRANHFRRQNEFDKAVAAYERILDEDNADAEAHWGVVLSRFGIEYVEDPVSHERIPTCHRVQSASILTDADYLAALENASDSYTRQLYEKEAHRIADIQKGILAISSQEEPYDVFICYKESTDGGTRTRDSALAQDIYYQLTQNGYKVFFSRITLESKLGQQYEPYIFAALNSARVMLVVGTKPEYFNAVWLKNEWSRYLALMKQDRSRLLIPCYRDMDPYDLPEELSALQSQDMGKIGFMQDLLHGVQKVLSADKTAPSASAVNAAPAINAGVAPLLKRAFMFLEDGEWESAREYCERVLDADPENARAYLGELMADLQVHTEQSLRDQKEPFDGNSSYQKAVRFADQKLRQELTGYIGFIQERNENARKEAIYLAAKKQMEKAITSEKMSFCAEQLESIRGYKDADVLTEKCAELAQEMRLREEEARKDAIYDRAVWKQEENYYGSYGTAIELFTSIRDWKDSEARIAACQERRKEMELEQKRQKQRQEEWWRQEEAKKKRIRLILCIALAVVGCLLVVKLIIPS